MKKKSALLVSISMVLVAVLALTTASFAWFSASMNPSLGGFDVNVTTSNALLVGVKKAAQDVDKIQFSTVLAAGDIALGEGNNVLKDIPSKNAVPHKFALTNATPRTVDSTTIKLDDATGNILFSKVKDPNLADLSTTATYDDVTNPVRDNTTDGVADPIDAYYIKFDVYLKSNLAGKSKIEVYLDDDKLNTLFNPNKVYNTTTPAETDNQYYVTTALRMATVTEKMYEDNTASTAATTAQKQTTLTVVEIDNRLPTHLQNIIDSRKAYTSVPFMANADYNFATPAGNGTIDGTTKNNPGIKLLEMSSNSIHKVTIYMWIEGNDPQCINQISAGSLSTKIAFKGVVVPVPAP